MRRLCFLIAFIVCIHFPIPVLADQENSNVLLVVSQSGEAEWLSQLIRACGKQVDAVTEYDFSPSLLEGRGFLITTSPIPCNDLDGRENLFTIRIGSRVEPPEGVRVDHISGAQIQLTLESHTQAMFLSGLTVIQSHTCRGIGSVTFANDPGRGSFPYAVYSNRDAYAPWYQENGLTAQALGELLRICFEGTASLTPGRMYILLDEIYPFSDLDMLQKTADAFSNNGIPFILRVMPVYDNLEYPAFTRYANALLYAQSRGGSIVLHDPIIRYQEAEREPLADKLSRAVYGLTEKGVELWPMENPPLIITLADVRNIRAGIPDTPRQNFGTLPVDSMISLKIPESSEDLDEFVRLINANWLSLDSYRKRFTQEEPPSVEIPGEEEPYQYREQGEALMESFFNSANQVLVTVVITFLAIFMLLLLISRKIYLRKFYKKKPKNK